MQELVDYVLIIQNRLQEIDDLSFLDDTQKLLNQIKSKNYKSARQKSFEIYRMMIESGGIDNVVSDYLNKISLLLESI